MAQGPEWRGARDQLGLRRGTEATWQRPGGPRRRRTGRGQVAGRPRGHVGTRVGRHAATWAPVWGATRPRGRPCGAPRVGSVIEGIETINRGIHSPIYTHHFPFFSLCGTMFPHGLTLQATWTRGERRISSRTATIAWTKVHTISKSSTCVKCYLSKAIGWLTWRHVATREAPDLLQKWITQDRDRTVHSPEDQSDGPDTLWKNSTIVAWSNRDRGAFEPRSESESGGIISTTSGRRSTNDQDHDRGPIVAKMRLIWSQIQADFSRNWSHDTAPKESLPQRPQTTPTTASIGHDLRANFPL